MKKLQMYDLKWNNFKFAYILTNQSLFFAIEP